MNPQVKWIRVQISRTHENVGQVPTYHPRAWEAEMGSLAGLAVTGKLWVQLRDGDRVSGLGMVKEMSSISLKPHGSMHTRTYNTRTHIHTNIYTHMNTHIQH